eukprot:GHVR01181398.1.p1 GENE.GHVR01181398.1~~GHVR01181398.1.p1  ORF type:complete len:174 (+),score=5.19 GHVR01181398.1:72-593(+)
MKITDMSSNDRPRERLEDCGPQDLSNAELLAIILKSGTRKENVLQMYLSILSKYNLTTLSNCTLSELCSLHGIGKAKTSQIVALFELYQRIPNTLQRPTIMEVADIVQRYQYMKSLSKEHFVAVYLDTKHGIIADETISIGTLNQSLMHPREVFHGAIKNLAYRVIQPPQTLI